MSLTQKQLLSEVHEKVIRIDEWMNNFKESNGEQKKKFADLELKVNELSKEHQRHIGIAIGATTAVNTIIIVVLGVLGVI